MYKFKICTDDSGVIDWFIVEGETIEDIEKQSQWGVDIRGWKNYWSEEL